ncbi:p1/s1 nuclease, putative [Plasmodium gallinaceum]|uniref:P1/s1 nuclease, putative n=1 Tax=Plasmodium gallinaceum TaxID=5849 RepID=A0A1J1GSX7_PLAGA|nr:p1/s1 nuclease, putative [Plasmodium gallinaceum]CRG95638.1 p1/s1 nuclease, putative [Plasmodium gallinaceum]
MNRFIFSFILFNLLIFKKITCWSDEGHMLISAIAYRGLTDEERAVLDKIFMNYKEDNHFNHPVLGSIWPDHIKSFDYKYPNNERRIDAIDLMNGWHFINIPYNPLQVHIDLFYKYYYKKTEHGLSVLKYTFKTLKNINKKENHGTYFAYNFHLRFFIHIFGDLHQPLHTITFYNENFLEGDHGGNDISVRYNNNVDKLHYLCDTVFHSRAKKWPQITLDEIFNEADSLMRSYPREYFGNRLEKEMDEIEYLDFIVNESYSKAVDYIYSNFPHDSLNKETTYVLSNFFVINLKKLLNEQIVLGGYRLTRYLKIMIDNVPKDLA